MKEHKISDFVKLLRTFCLMLVAKPTKNKEIKFIGQGRSLVFLHKYCGEIRDCKGGVFVCTGGCHKIFHTNDIFPLPSLKAAQKTRNFSSRKIHS
jgi:hypothetical protein